LLRKSFWLQITTWQATRSRKSTNKKESQWLQDKQSLFFFFLWDYFCELGLFASVAKSNIFAVRRPKLDDGFMLSRIE
jgi:hypothetical protein